MKDVFEYVMRTRRCFVTGFTARTKQFLWPHTCVHLNMGTCFPIHLTSFHYTENNDHDSEVKRLLELYICFAHQLENEPNELKTVVFEKFASC